MKICITALLLVLLIPASPAATKKHERPAIPISEAEDCNLQFAGHSRADVKLRTVDDGAHYTVINEGRAISVADWLAMACSRFDPDTEGEAIKDTAIRGVETQKVTVEGYLMAARFENGAKGDHGIHAEIADSPRWSVQNPHIIVEVPPGQAYCPARKELWDLAKISVSGRRNYVVFNDGPKIRVTGYVFLDIAHGGSHFCTNSGGRGVKDRDGHSDVRGLWEVHPVFEVKVVN